MSGLISGALSEVLFAMRFLTILVGGLIAGAMSEAVLAMRL